MRILFVNHTFPPESYAGSELCVLQLARELCRRGHQAAVFYRYADPQADEFHVREEVYDGLPVFRINNTYRGVRRFQDIYLNPIIGAKFSRVLYRWQPDLVHFHHLTNLSLSLVSEAKSFGCGVVMTLHDYWLLCQRGQLLKRDLELCHGPSDRACRTCLAPQLLRGKAQRLVSRLQQLPRRGSSARPGIDLLDLHRVEITAPDRNYVGRVSFGMGEEPESVLLAHPPATIDYHLRFEHPAELTTAIAMHPATYGQEGSGVRFAIHWNDERLFEREVDPKQQPEHRRWHEVRVALPPGEGRLRLSTQAARGEDNRFCTAGWRAPWIETQLAPVAVPLRHDRSWLRKRAERLANSLVHFSAEAQEGIEHRRNWVRRVWEEVDLFISPSQFLREFFIRHGLPEEKIIYSDNGFYPPEAVKLRRVEKPIRFGYIGTWIPSKGIALLLEAFREIDPREAQLAVHGFFPGFDGYENFEAELRALAGPAVTWVGKYEPEQVHDILREMDCFVMPSIWWENSPMTLHEAFLCRVPILTADVGGMAEQIRFGGGITFRHRDAESLREKIRQIIRNPQILEYLRESIPPVKTVEDHAEEMLRVYEGVLKEAASG